MIACDNPGSPIEWFHFKYVGLVDAPSGKWLCTECAVNIFKAITVQKCSVAMWNSYSCKINNLQQALFRCIKRKLLPLLKYILFLINSVWTVSFCFVLFVALDFNLCQFVPRGRGIWSQDFPQGLEVLVRFDQGLVKSPNQSRVWGWGFQLTGALQEVWLYIRFTFGVS